MAKKSTTKQTSTNTAVTEPRLKKLWKEDFSKKLQKELGCSSIMQVPKLDKIVINMGIGPMQGDKALENGIRDMTTISGQKPVATKARIAVSNFKIRENQKVGCKVTMRGDRALHFFDKLVTVVLPRIRDFQGLSPKSFDGRGNYAFGLKEQLVFPEISYDNFDKIRGMDIIICTTAKNDKDAIAFLKMMGLPIREK